MAAKDIDEPPGKETIKAFPDLVCEINVPPETFRIVDIYLFAGNIEVAAAENAFLRAVVSIQKMLKPLKPPELILKLLMLPVSTLGYVTIDNGDIPKNSTDETVFVGWFPVIKAEGNVLRFGE
jgi:hypothetical protein